MAEIPRPLSVMLLGHGAVRVGAPRANQDRAERIIELASLPVIDLDDRSIDDLNRVAFGFTTGDRILVPTRYFSSERVPFIVSGDPRALLRHDGSLVPLTAGVAEAIEHSSGEDVEVVVIVEGDAVATIHLLAAELKRGRQLQEFWTDKGWDINAEQFVSGWQQRNPGRLVLRKPGSPVGWLDGCCATGFYHITTSLRDVRASALKSRLQLLREVDPDFVIPGDAYGRSRIYPKVGLGGSGLDRLPDTVSVTYSKQRAFDLEAGMHLAVRCAKAQTGSGPPVDALEILDFVLDLHGFPGGIDAAMKGATDWQWFRMYVAYLFCYGLEDDAPVPFFMMVSRIADDLQDPHDRYLLKRALLTHGIRRGFLDENGRPSSSAMVDVPGQWASLRESGFHFVPYSDTNTWLSELLDWWSDSLEGNEPIPYGVLAKGRSASPADLKYFVEVCENNEYVVLQALDNWLGMLTGALGVQGPRIGFLAQDQVLAQFSPDDVGIVVLQVKSESSPIFVSEEWELTFEPSDVRLVPYAEISRVLSGQRPWTRYEVAGFVNTIVDEMGGDPVAIDSGLCDEFADRLAGRLGAGAEVQCADLASPLAGHCWVRYLSRVYDPETPTGVDHPWQLNSYRRRGAKNRPTWYG